MPFVQCADAPKYTLQYSAHVFVVVVAAVAAAAAAVVAAVADAIFGRTTRVAQKLLNKICMQLLHRFRFNMRQY